VGNSKHKRGTLPGRCGQLQAQTRDIARQIAEQQCSVAPHGELLAALPRRWRPGML